MARDDPFLFVRALDVAEDLPPGRIISFEFVDEERKADKVKITIDNTDLDFYDDEILRKGSIIAFGFGVGDKRSPVRSAVVTSIKGPILSPVVEAKALSILMATARRRRVFEGLTRSEVVEQIADENGFGEDFRFVDQTVKKFESISQANESDAALLMRLARKEEFEFYVDHTGFHWHERNLDQTPLRTLVFSGGDQGDFVGIPNIDNDVTAKPGRVRVKTRDPTTKSPTESKSDNSTDSARSGTGEFIEIVPPEGGDTFVLSGDARGGIGETVRGVSRLGELFTSQVGSQVVKLTASLEQRLASEEPVRATRADDAPSESRAMYRRAQRTAVKLSGAIHGDPLMGAKQVVLIEGLGRKFTGRYYVKQVTHTISRSAGYTTKIRVVSDGHGGHSTKGSSRFDLGRVAGRPPSTPRRSTPEDIAAALSRLTDVARNSGPTASNVLEAAFRAEATFRNGGQAALGDVRDALAAAVEGSRPEALLFANPGLTNAALQAKSVVDRAAGDEVRSGAQVNRKDAAESTSRLQEVQRVSPEGDDAVEYRPPGGNKSR